MNSNNSNSTWHIENITTNKEKVVTNTEAPGNSDQVIFVLVIERNSGPHIVEGSDDDSKLE